MIFERDLRSFILTLKHSEVKVVLKKMSYCKKICIIIYVPKIIRKEDYILRGSVWIPLTNLTPPHCCACPKSGPRFPLAYVMVFFCVQWFEVRKSYFFCWYWWNCWPSLLELSFHNSILSLLFIFNYDKAMGVVCIIR